LSKFQLLHTKGIKTENGPTVWGSDAALSAKKKKKENASYNSRLTTTSGPMNNYEIKIKRGKDEKSN
jgi:hypothetical protein